jgi:hypothetical protein
MVSGEGDDLTQPGVFERACKEAGGEYGDLVRSPGGVSDTGCQLPDGTKLFVHGKDIMTGERPDDPSNAMLTVEYNANSLSTEISAYSAASEGPQRIDFYGPDDLGSATFTTEY